MICDEALCRLPRTLGRYDRLAPFVADMVFCQNPFMEHVVPKKSLGQHFLTDRNIAARIVREFAPQPDEPVLEIGPGEGALTGLLVESGCRLIAVELDPRAAEKIRSTYGDRVEVIGEDVLRIDLHDIARRYGVEQIRVIGNIPYYITSPILFHLIDNSSAVIDAMLMMQLEVAQRLTALPRTKEYGILAVVTQTFAEVTRLFTVGPKCFYPPPRVNSAVVRLVFRKLEGVEGNEEVHRRIVRTAFNQRRKTLRNSLSQLSTPEARDKIFQEAGIDPAKRAEELFPEDFIRLAGIFTTALARSRG